MAVTRSDYSLSQLDLLEAESIHVMREVAAEFRNPVLLYSIGKDSSALLHLARKAFYPAKPPLPLLHVDTTWKFRDMIAFRDATARQFGLDLRVHTNPDGLRQDINPFDHGSSVYTQVMKTDALKQALTEGRYDFAIGGARRDEERSRAKERVFSIRSEVGQREPLRVQLEDAQRLGERREAAGVHGDRAHGVVTRNVRSSASISPTIPVSRSPAASDV